LNIEKQLENFSRETSKYRITFDVYTFEDNIEADFRNIMSKVMNLIQRIKDMGPVRAFRAKY
jgi:tRNA(Ser,Leu) C12 N-acetylase TAN1